MPSVAGRPATYIFRQYDMKIGNRKGPWVELMNQVVEKLGDNDMIALFGIPRLARSVVSATRAGAIRLN